MRKRLFYIATSSFAISTLTVFLGFYIHRLLPLKIQWAYVAFLIIVVVFFFQAITRLFRDLTRSYLTGVSCAFLTLLIFIIGLFSISSIRREVEVTAFLKQNELKLKEVIQTKKSGHNIVRVKQILKDLNIHLIEGKEGDYHFELYSFWGYGYRIVFAENNEEQKPASPGGSPTVSWFKVKNNWLYYSYFD